MKIPILSNFETVIRNFFISRQKNFVKGKNNQVVLINENGEQTKLKKPVKGLRIKVVGDNNYVEIQEPVSFNNSTIELLGNNHSCIVQPTEKYINNTTLTCGYGNDSKISIGKNISVEAAYIYASGKATSIEIGEDCMMASQVFIKTCDDHCIVSSETGELLNHNRDVKIGKHCWICPFTKIFKGSMGNNSILATCSVLTKDFSGQDNVMLGGVSAKVIKQNIDWHRETPEEKFDL